MIFIPARCRQISREPIAGKRNARARAPATTRPRHNFRLGFRALAETYFPMPSTLNSTRASVSPSLPLVFAHTYTHTRLHFRHVNYLIACTDGAHVEKSLLRLEISTRRRERKLFVGCGTFPSARAVDKQFLALFVEKERRIPDRDSRIRPNSSFIEPV